MYKYGVLQKAGGAGLSDEVLLQQDTFLEGSDTALNLHTPTPDGGGSWTIQSGDPYVVASTDDVRWTTAATHIGSIPISKPVTKMVIDAKITVATREAGVITSFTDTNNYSYVVFTSDATPNFFLEAYDVISGSAVLRGTGSNISGATLSTYETITVEVTSSGIKAYPNSDTSNTLSASLTHGDRKVVGLFGKTNSFFLDNLLIYG
jgi:hypothetical protein